MYVHVEVCYDPDMSLSSASIQIVFYDHYAIATLVEVTWKDGNRWDRNKDQWRLDVTAKDVESLSFRSAVKLALRELDGSLDW